MSRFLTFMVSLVCCLLGACEPQDRDRSWDHVYSLDLSQNTPDHRQDDLWTSALQDQDFADQMLDLEVTRDGLSERPPRDQFDLSQLADLSVVDLSVIDLSVADRSVADRSVADLSLLTDPDALLTDMLTDILTDISIISDHEIEEITPDFDLPDGGLVDQGLTPLDMESLDMEPLDMEPLDMASDPLPECGDGVINGDEECDDRGGSVSCTVLCRHSFCGDLVVNPYADEACDEGAESATCDTDCSPAECGDGVVNTNAGEECDEGRDSPRCAHDCRHKPYPLMFRNVVTPTHKLSQLVGTQGVAVADYDLDGDLDIFVVSRLAGTPQLPHQGSRLFRNDGQGQFNDVTALAGLAHLRPPPIEPPMLRLPEQIASIPGEQWSAAWGDYDRDGYPDLLLTGFEVISLYHNQGDGTFAEVTEAMGLPTENGCFNMGATWFDFDHDGDLDLYVCNWGLCARDQLYVNEGDALREVGLEMGLAVTAGSNSITATPLDLNEDGWIDIYVANDLEGPNWVLINQGGQTFVEQGALWGLDHRSTDMGIGVVDYNLDGLLDIYVSTIGDNPLFERQNDDTFVDVSYERGVQRQGWGWSVLWGDYDLDGDEDLFISTGMIFEEENRYLENQTFSDHPAADSSSDSAPDSEERQPERRFIERSTQLDLGGEGLHLSAVDFDYDLDGDLDILVSHSVGHLALLENQLDPASPRSDHPRHWLKVSLEGTLSNLAGIGARVVVTTPHKQLHQLFTGVECFSQNILPLHFGLGTDDQITELLIIWPSGVEDHYTDLAVDQEVKVTEQIGLEEITSPPIVKPTGCMDIQACNTDERALIPDHSCAYLPIGELLGPREVMLFDTVNYELQLDSAGSDDHDHTVSDHWEWEVTGGHIVAEADHQVTIRWEIGVEHVVRVTLRRPECSSRTVEREVDVGLTLAGLSAHRMSIARLWIELLLQAIREDYARPTVHARNLFHLSVVLYDAWALYHPPAIPYLIQQPEREIDLSLVFPDHLERSPAQVLKTMSYAAYYLLMHRFQRSPGAEPHQARLYETMRSLGYSVYPADLVYEAPLDIHDHPSLDEATRLGVLIAQIMIDYGREDGSQEELDYDNLTYVPVNPPLYMLPTGEIHNELRDPNRWQPLVFPNFVDQSGHALGQSVPFIGAEWGEVRPFALTRADLTQRNARPVYHDPGPPPLLQLDPHQLTPEELRSHQAYQRGFAQVIEWGAHLDASDGVIWDISPRSLGGLTLADIPIGWQTMGDFYLSEGGDSSSGHTLNPHTGAPYEPIYVPRGDYTRVLAEFWADGPDSETPPGHWFTILNYVNDHPASHRRFAGEGPELDPLEWEVKSYFLLGGAMHDAAVAAWSLKGAYDYIRPISALRFMARRGQSSETTHENYHFAGLPLIPGVIEEITPDDPLAGHRGEYVGQLKFYTWIGHDPYEDSPQAPRGVGWIRANTWWPYQRASFVTPPFAGYVSGHSTYSRAAAEVLTALTGDPYFPGGYGEFLARRDEFLVFERGPSVNVTLRWATYRDAADQCSLSRIWGGIHPPADDLPGRHLGAIVGQSAFIYGRGHF